MQIPVLFHSINGDVREKSVCATMHLNLLQSFFLDDFKV